MSNQNPFKIEEGEQLNSVSKNSQTIAFMSQTMQAMEISKTKSFFIPESIFSKQPAASGAVKAAEKILVENIASMKDCKFTTKTVKDESGKYLGTRVWRIN